MESGCESVGEFDAEFVNMSSFWPLMR